MFGRQGNPHNVGLDLKGNPMEILVKHNGVSVVFHAMKLRKVFEGLMK
jgi:hypothetical protein